MPQLNWHIQRNEHLALELSYDLGLDWSHLFCNNTDLTAVTHESVLDLCASWEFAQYRHAVEKLNVSISLPNPTSDNAIDMSIVYWYNKNAF